MQRTLIALAFLTSAPAFAQTAADSVPPPATPAPAVAPAPAPIPEDRRAAVTQICMAEAKARAEKLGATDLTLRKVEDTDLKSGGYATMRASVNLVTTDSKGKVKTQKKKFGCQTRDNVVVGFDYDG
ncbi:hypothetical protein L6Q21_04810 [Sandaracinobacter sp. RS1-74]|uniref:hypothetical protein n=1 Tax=Sandaracinobacteroides sayramensis TaxID=2913411 RepID=UPI001EDAF1A8|nr:hypothetical protein [Sandaracinobacteroides sayramensis]MCG2840301.1 hypothetical protein [Sandaracinobacteroides sayramensis]